jgi:tetratricopeptide (TPR) repeat protein
MTMNTPYDVLGVPRDASDETIRMAFRKAAKACHPDLNAGDPTAEHQFRQVIAAYEMLKTPQQRAVYDQYLAAHDRHVNQYVKYVRSIRRERGRRFVDTAVAGLVSGSVVAVVVWLSVSMSSTQDTSGPQTPPIAAAETTQPASQQVAAVDDSGNRQDGGGGRESDWPAVATNRHGPADPSLHIQQPTSNLHSTADHPAPPALLAREWEQVQASGDPMAIWEFSVRNPGAPESELARSKLIALIDSAEDLFLLQVLRVGGADAIAERAQQRLTRLGALSVAKVNRTAVSGSDDRATDTTTSTDPDFYLARGERWFREDDLDRATADFNEAVRLQPGRALAYRHRGNAWSGKGDWNRALADYEVAIRIDPNDPTAFRDRGILWRRHGDLDRALIDFDRAIRLGFTDASAYNERGVVWYEKKRYDRAIADFNQALKINPNLVSALINRGIALRSKGDLDRAIADFDQAIRIDPNIPAAYYNRGLARSDKHDFDQATTDHAKARELMSTGAAPHLQ